jgi:hypothetical protein
MIMPNFIFKILIVIASFQINLLVIRMGKQERAAACIPAHRGKVYIFSQLFLV